MKERLALASFWEIEAKILKNLWGEGGTTSIFSKGHFEPPIDIYETEEGIIMKMEIPGMKKREIGVEFEGDTLIIKGMREDKSRRHKVAYHQMEINYGMFERRIRIGIPIRESRVTATYRDGFLEVRLPRRRPGK